MNPPFNDRQRSRASPDERRELAHLGSKEMLAAWLRSAGRLLRAGGTISLIWRADALDAVLQALAAGFGAAVVLPIHAKPGKAAIRVLVRATKASRAALTLLPGFFLEDAAGQVSKEAEAVLRQGAMLPLASL